MIGILKRDKFFTKLRVDNGVYSSSAFTNPIESTRESAAKLKQLYLRMFSLGV